MHLSYVWHFLAKMCAVWCVYNSLVADGTLARRRFPPPSPTYWILTWLRKFLPRGAKSYFLPTVSQRKRNVGYLCCGLFSNKLQRITKCRFFARGQNFVYLNVAPENAQEIAKKCIKWVECLNNSMFCENALSLNKVGLC